LIELDAALKRRSSTVLYIGLGRSIGLWDASPLFRACFPSLRVAQAFRVAFGRLFIGRG